MPPPFTAGLAASPMTGRMDPASLTQLAHAYGSLVFHAAYRVLGNAAQAEDVQQDLFLRLLESPPDEVASWPAWLRTSATRLAIDRLRRGQRWTRLLPRFRAEPSPTPAGPECLTEQRQRAAQLRLQLARLPRLQAQCFALRVLDGQDIVEIARQLGITDNHARVALHRAGQRLERLIGESAAVTAAPNEETSA